MKSYLAALILTAALLFSPSLCPRLFAETISVGDYTQPTDFSVVEEGDEILAPVLLGLKHAGFEYVCVGKGLTLFTPSGKEIVLVIGSREGRIGGEGGERLELKAAPVFIEQRCYLPLRSLAEALGMLVVWDKEQARLALLPKLTRLEIDEGEKSVRVRLGAEVKLAYSEGRLVDPPRYYIDIDNLAAAGRREREVKRGSIEKVRSGARTEGIFGLRVVLDLSREVECWAEVSENGCELTLVVPKEGEEAIRPPAELREVRIEAAHERAATVILELSGAAAAESEMKDKGRTLVVRLHNCSSRMEDLPPLPKDGLVSDMKMRTTGKEVQTQELAFRLRRESQHLLLAEGRRVQVLLGDFRVSDLKVVVDAGHGGGISGATGRSGLKEKDVNLDIALKLEKLLKDAGAKVYMTRREDCELRPIPITRKGIDKPSWRAELCMRPGLANEVKADIFVSIHSNASASSNPHEKSGTEVYYYPTPRGKLLAWVLQERLVKKLKRNDNGIFANEKFWVLKEAQMPAVLVEVAYLTNKEEEELLGMEEFRAKAAEAIFWGIKQYAEIGGARRGIGPEPVVEPEAEEEAEAEEESSAEAPEAAAEARGGEEAATTANSAEAAEPKGEGEAPESQAGNEDAEEGEE